jgi:hypothetical protein
MMLIPLVETVVTQSLGGGVIMLCIEMNEAMTKSIHQSIWKKTRLFIAAYPS